MELVDRLTQLCTSLVVLRPGAARVIVEPMKKESGYWFGGGNMLCGADGTLYLTGRYRNAGDSRTGVAAGTRGLELAVFASTDRGRHFEKILSWDKSALDSPSGRVLSIEGSCLRQTPEGIELYVSTEKIGVPYPERVADFLKPGAGVWTIDVIRAPSFNELRAAPVDALFSSQDPLHLHVKDPFILPSADGDQLGYCSHPYNWSSSNTGAAQIPPPGRMVTNPQHGVFSRGTTWDVAMARGTCVLTVPRSGICRDRTIRLLFYCGGECVRSLDEHSAAVTRPRGYSCEELGGAAFYENDNLHSAIRLSDILPLFVSPSGTGCCRYVDVLETPDGFYATWQQSRSDFSQPLMMNFLSREHAEEILS